MFWNNDRPFTIKQIMESLAPEGTKTTDLATTTRTKIFDFSYPLTSNISKEDFECMILNKFIARRIGFDTYTAFKIQLNVKLNEIMPFYNKMIDAVGDWSIFDGEEYTKTSNANTSTSLNNESNNTTTSDRRYSDTPQNQLELVQQGQYLTTYNLDNNAGHDISNSTGSSNNVTTENYTKSVSDKIATYKEMQENIKNIYTLIFNDLTELFYGLVD